MPSVSSQAVYHWATEPPPPPPPNIQHLIHLGNLQVRGQDARGDDDDEKQLMDENPIIVLMEFGKLMGFRLMDLFAALDKDGSKSLDHNEIRTGLRVSLLSLSFSLSPTPSLSVLCNDDFKSLVWETYMSLDMWKTTMWLCIVSLVKLTYRSAHSNQSICCPHVLSCPLSESSDSGHPGGMPRLIWVFFLQTLILLVFITSWFL